MFLEQPKQTNEAISLIETILTAEKAELSPELMPMWNAENNACFPHFLTYANKELGNVLDQASDGNVESINFISLEYKKYRNELETDMLNHSPLIYDSYIEAVAQGDSEKASIYMNEYIDLIDKEDED